MPHALTGKRDLSLRRAGLGRARVQRAAVAYAARCVCDLAQVFLPAQHAIIVDRIARLQPDDAAAVNQATRLDHAFVVYNRANQIARGARTQDHLAAVGLDHPLVGDICRHHRAVYGKAQQSVPGEVECDLLARPERDRPQPRCQHALVAHLAAGGEHDVTAVNRADRALVDHAAAAIAIATREHIAASHEVGVGDVQRGRDQPGDVDDGPLAEDDTVRVDQENLAVGGELAQDDRGIGAADAVKRDGGAGGLREIHAFLGANAEALPIDDQLVASLRNSHRLRIRRADRAAALHHHPARRAGPGIGDRARDERATKRRNDRVFLEPYLRRAHSALT